MLTTLLNNAEYLALGMNLFLLGCSLLRQDLARIYYWGGASLLVYGVIRMRS